MKVPIKLFDDIVLEHHNEYLNNHFSAVTDQLSPGARFPVRIGSRINAKGIIAFDWLYSFEGLAPKNWQILLIKLQTDEMGLANTSASVQLKEDKR